MINIEFKFNQPEPTYKNTYMLTVYYSHGDADGETTEQYLYHTNDERELKHDVLGLITFINSDADLDDDQTEVADIFEAQGIEDSYDEAQAWRDKFYKGDITCDNSVGAGLTGYDIVYYDSRGTMFHIDVHVNGRKVE